MKRFLQIGSCCLALVLILNIPSLFGADMAQQIVESFKKTIVPGTPLLGSDITIVDTYQIGHGPTIGKIELVQGKGYIVHRRDKTAFEATKGRALFQGDTLVTGENSRIQARLDDKSTFSLNEHSKLILTKVFYKAATKERNSEINLRFGKARFKVLKAAEGSQYKVTTPTAVAGIRGSDFALAVYPDEHKTAALSIGKRLANLVSVRPAYAEPSGPPLTTALLTGKATTISFAGFTGPANMIGPYSISFANAGAPASMGMVISSTLAVSVLETIGPHLAYMKMPAKMK